MKLLTVIEAAAALGISQQRVRALIADGRLKAERAGARLWLIHPKALDAVRVRPTGRPKEGTK